MAGLTPYLEAIVESNASSGSPSSDGGSETPGIPTPEQEAAAIRRKSLLSRDRGRFGTVQTGFRGILTQVLSPGQRKTLLGE